MDREKVWVKDGVEITYLPFQSMLGLKVSRLLRAAYEYPLPTAENPDRKALPTEVYAFEQAMPCVLRVKLPENAPPWASILKEAVESPDWLKDPVSDFLRIERRSPPETIFNTYEGYEATREQQLRAPVELQKPLPHPPSMHDEDVPLEERIAKKKSTTASGASSKRKPLTVPPKPPGAARPVK